MRQMSHLFKCKMQSLYFIVTSLQSTKLCFLSLHIDSFGVSNIYYWFDKNLFTIKK